MAMRGSVRAHARAQALESDTEWRQQHSRGEPSHHPLLSEPVPAHMLPLMLEVRAEAAHARAAARVELGINGTLSARALLQPVQFGLFAALAPDASTRTVLFRKDERVCSYGGVLVSADAVKARDLPRTHVRTVKGGGLVLDGLPLACMLRRPIPGTASRLVELVAAGVSHLLPSADTFTAEQLARFGASPLGFMANTAPPKRCNVKVQYVASALGANFQVPVLVASRDICAGEEILSPYNSEWGRQLLNEGRKRAHAAVAPDVDIAPRVMCASLAAARFQRLNLLRDLPAHPLARQRANLLRFIEQRQEEFSQQLYTPWTVDGQSGQAQAPVEVRASSLLPGLQGVFLRSQQLGQAEAGTAAAPSSLLISYPGVLMTESLHQAFAASFHCPTALSVPMLDYYQSSKQLRTRVVGAQQARSDEAGPLVKMVLVGDPTQPGPIINDGPRSGRPGQPCPRARAPHLQRRAYTAGRQQCAPSSLLLVCA